MKRLVESRYLLKKNILALAAFSLCVYFCYHISFGERSALKLMTLEQETTRLDTVHQNLKNERLTLENRVIRLRPGSLDPDLLEERARYVLGYTYPGEQIFIQTH